MATATTGGSCLGHTVLKTDSHLAQIFGQKVLYNLYSFNVLISQTDFHAPKNSGLSRTHLYIEREMPIKPPPKPVRRPIPIAVVKQSHLKGKEKVHMP